MAETEREGVSKFDLRFTPAAPIRPAALHGLIGWRDILFRLGLIGQDPQRYGGLAYGNVSLSLGAGEFLISATQTGGLTTLTEHHFAHVQRCQPSLNRVWASGPLPPSSEAMTHGVIYANRPEAGCVLHVHSPSIWRSAEYQGIPVTDAAVAYGTPAMAQTVRGLIDTERMIHKGLFAMGGHEDGVVSFAGDVETAACALLRALVD
ncbi:MAG: class II aldolase/adducin family protein [Chromatiales bacterium]|nr:class II aldolase/adducin family protein [Chromatiales bacterium]